MHNLRAKMLLQHPATWSFIPTQLCISHDLPPSLHSELHLWVPTTQSLHEVCPGPGQGALQPLQDQQDGGFCQVWTNILHHSICNKRNSEIWDFLDKFSIQAQFGDNIIHVIDGEFLLEASGDSVVVQVGEHYYDISNITFLALKY